MTSSVELRATILGRIDARRDAGRITSGFFSHAGPGATAEHATAIAKSKGFSQPTSGWRTIERPEALRILERILGQDLAYDAPLMSSSEAHELADAFLNLIADVCAYVTNGTWARTVRLSMPLSSEARAGTQSQVLRSIRASSASDTKKALFCGWRMRTRPAPLTHSGNIGSRRSGRYFDG